MDGEHDTINPQSCFGLAFSQQEVSPKSPDNPKKHGFNDPKRQRMNIHNPQDAAPFGVIPGERLLRPPNSGAASQSYYPRKRSNAPKSRQRQNRQRRRPVNKATAKPANSSPISIQTYKPDSQQKLAVPDDSFRHRDGSSDAQMFRDSSHMIGSLLSNSLIDFNFELAWNPLSNNRMELWPRWLDPFTEPLAGKSLPNEPPGNSELGHDDAIFGHTRINPLGGSPSARPFSLPAENFLSEPELLFEELEEMLDLVLTNSSSSKNAGGSTSNFAPGIGDSSKSMSNCIDADGNRQYLPPIHFHLFHPRVWFSPEDFGSCLLDQRILVQLRQLEVAGITEYIGITKELILRSGVERWQSQELFHAKPQ
ncbi:hypothetical protein B0J14DRAFT_252895 [Halenospora varia]|nr:hypothetical protein B0J14DRAFT_252895 [Halenospora varia]